MRVACFDLYQNLSYLQLGDILEVLGEVSFYESDCNIILEYLSDLNVTKPQVHEVNIAEITLDHIGDLVLIEGNVTYFEKTGFIIININDSSFQVRYSISPSIVENINIDESILYTHIKCQGVVTSYDGVFELTARDVEDVNL